MRSSRAEAARLRGLDAASRLTDRHSPRRRPSIARTPRSEPFEALLLKLGPDRRSCGPALPQLRQRLVAVFEYRRCPRPEELADERSTGSPGACWRWAASSSAATRPRYVFGVAWNVARESFRRAGQRAAPRRMGEPPRRQRLGRRRRAPSRAASSTAWNGSPHPTSDSSSTITRASAALASAVVRISLATLAQPKRAAAEDPPYLTIAPA
jgi:hypothetical protein